VVKGIGHSGRCWTCAVLVIRAALWLVGAVLVAPLALAAPVAMQWVTVGDPGNPDAPGMGAGAVSYVYQIGKYDVTNVQYVAFLNAKDPTGANALGLYDSWMTADLNVAGINFDASEANGSKYSAISGAENHPVAYATFYSAARFANWLNNGQGNASTETGSYTLLGGTPEPSNGRSLTRNPGNGIFINNASEWVKAGYYKGGGTNAGWWLYATRSDTQPTSAPPSLTATNSANYTADDGSYAVTGSSIYDPQQNYLTDVGAYGNSPGPYGTFDQSGDLWQWLETTDDPNGGPSPARLVGGGAWSSTEQDLRRTGIAFDGAAEGDPIVGFRLVYIPEPLGLSGAVLGGAALLARRRRVASQSA
jgi:formylglycine-generating enzyme